MTSFSSLQDLISISEYTEYGLPTESTQGTLSSWHGWTVFREQGIPINTYVYTKIASFISWHLCIPD